MQQAKKHVEDGRWPLESPTKHPTGTEEDALLAEAAAIMNNPDSVLAGIDFGAKVEHEAIAA